MITKTRLEELINQKATIWCPYYMFIEEGIQLDNKDYIDDEILYVVNGVWKYNFRNPPLKLEYLFENKEDAEFALKYQNIARTETLSLPTWEELFTKTEHQIEIDNFHAFVIDMPYKKDNGRIVIAKYNEFKVGYIIFDEPLTKENYLEACELCRKLFLGENDDK